MITLTDVEFDELWVQRHDIRNYLHRGSTAKIEWFFQDSETKRVHTAIYKDVEVVHIREVLRGTGLNYGRIYPTKRGILLSKRSWDILEEKYDQVMAFLTEAKRIYQKIREEVVKQLTDIILECHGCKIDHPSQKQHQCLEDWEYRVEDNFLGAMSKLSYSEITLIFKPFTFLSEEFCERMLAHIVCNSKKMVVEAKLNVNVG